VTIGSGDVWCRLVQDGNESDSSNSDNKLGSSGAGLERAESGKERGTLVGVSSPSHFAGKSTWKLGGDSRESGATGRRQQREVRRADGVVAERWWV
jgi:hypothetical protein